MTRRTTDAPVPTGAAADLPLHTIDELAAHLEDIYTTRARPGDREADALPRRRAALAESALASVPRSRTPRPSRALPCNEPPPASGYGLGGDLRFAWRQLRRSPVVRGGRDR